jgi:hypothetical protein
MVRNGGKTCGEMTGRKVVKWEEKGRKVSKWREGTKHLGPFSKS